MGVEKMPISIGQPQDSRLIVMVLRFITGLFYFVHKLSNKFTIIFSLKRSIGKNLLKSYR